MSDGDRSKSNRDGIGAHEDAEERDHVQDPGLIEEGEAAELASEEEELVETPHAVVATVDDMEKARVLIEDLEEHGVPPRSITLLGDTVEPGSAGRRDEVEAGAFSELAKSVLAGAAVGALVGGFLGALISLIFPDAAIWVAVGLGAVFGAGVGGAAGGMSVAKYSSRARIETYTEVQEGVIAVGVDHADADVVAAAEEIMHRHGVRDVTTGTRGDFSS